MAVPPIRLWQPFSADAFRNASLHVNLRGGVMNRSVVYILPKPAYFAGGDNGSVTHALGVVEGLSLEGHEVAVISGKGLNNYRNQFPTSVSLYEIDPSSPFWAIRVAVSVFRQFRNGGPDTLIVRYAVSQILLCWLLNKIAMNYGATTILEVNSYALHHRSLPSIVRRVWHRVELWLTSQFHIAYAVSRALGDMLRRKDCRATVIVVPNGASSSIDPLGWSEDSDNLVTRFVYLGTLHRYYDFDLVLNGFRLLRAYSQDCELHFIGGGAMADQLRRATGGVAYVKFHGTYLRGDLPELLSAARDILVLPPKQKWDLQLTGGLSTKVFEYMALGAPILAPKMPELADVLTDGKSALIYEPEDARSFVRSARMLLTDVSLRKRIGAYARRDFERRFTWQARMRFLFQGISET